MLGCRQGVVRMCPEVNGVRIQKCGVVSRRRRVVAVPYCGCERGIGERLAKLELSYRREILVVPAILVET